MWERITQPSRAAQQQARSSWLGKPVSPRPGASRQSLLGWQAPSQAALHVSQPGDRLEREADAIADRAVAATAAPPLSVSRVAPALQRKCDACASGSPCAGCRDEEAMVQRKAIASDVRMPAARAPGILCRVGQPLDGAPRAFFESRLGHDFSHVRIHDDGEAHRQSRALGARAFTTGHDIAFGAGRPDCRDRNGRRLLAHELVHVMQQAGGAGASAATAGASLVQRQADDDTNRAETATDAPATTKQEPVEEACSAPHTCAEVRSKPAPKFDSYDVALGKILRACHLDRSEVTITRNAMPPESFCGDDPNSFIDVVTENNSGSTVGVIAGCPCCTKLGFTTMLFTIRILCDVKPPPSPSPPKPPKPGRGKPIAAMDSERGE
jgi:hypothetical protein